MIHCPIVGTYWMEQWVGYALCGAGVDSTRCSERHDEVTCEHCLQIYNSLSDLPPGGPHRDIISTSTPYFPFLCAYRQV